MLISCSFSSFVPGKPQSPGPETWTQNSAYVHVLELSCCVFVRILESGSMTGAVDNERIMSKAFLEAGFDMAKDKGVASLSPEPTGVTGAFVAGFLEPLDDG